LFHASFRPHLAVTPLRFATLHLHQVGTGLSPASYRTCTAYNQKARALTLAFVFQLWATEVMSRFLGNETGECLSPAPPHDRHTDANNGDSHPSASTDSLAQKRFCSKGTRRIAQCADGHHEADVTKR